MRRRIGKRVVAGMLARAVILFVLLAVAAISPAQAPVVARLAPGGQAPGGQAPAAASSEVAWQSVPSMDTSPLQSNHLRSVSCVTTSYCVAVGYFFNGLVNQALVEVYRDGTWSRIPAAQEPFLELNVLQGVSCVTTSYCVAVGYFFNGVVNRPLLEVLVGTAFQARAPSGSPDAGSEKLYGVSCVASGTCALVGDQVDNGVWRTLAGVYSSGTWSVSPGHQGALYGVSCTGAGYCMAVGDRVGLAAWQALAVSYSGAGWSPVTIGDTAVGETNVLRSVSCASASFCVAAGSYWNGALWQTLVDTWDGSAWSITSTPNTPAPEDDYLYSVSCASSLYCVAVGAHVTHAMIETYALGAWTITASPDSSTSSWDTLWGTSCAAVASCTSVGTRGIFNGTVRQTWVERSGSPGVQGYWMASTTGSVTGFGNGYFFGSASSILRADGVDAPQWPVIGIARGPYALGYWLVSSDGGIFAFGDAKYYGSMAGRRINRPVVGIASTPDGMGYWLVSSDGGIFAFGDAKFYGSMAGRRINRPVVGIASTPDGMGYWLVSSDGGIFAFGDAKFYGSMGARRINRPVVGIASTPDGLGYWLVSSDGGIFAFGDATFYGSMGARRSNAVVSSVVSTGS